MDTEQESHVTEMELDDDPFRPSNLFANTYILEMVLSFLPIVDLNNFRFVNSNWNREIRRFLKKVRTVEISDNNFEQAEKILKEKSSGNNAYLSRVECKTSNCSDPFFDKLIMRMGTHIHKLVLQNCQINVNSFQCLLLSDPFPNLHTLILSRTCYVDPQQGRKTLFLVDEENESVIKSLKKLEINERGPDSQTSLKNIAIICPNLISLAYGNCPCPDFSDFRGSNSTLSLSLLEYLQLAPIDGKKLSFHYFQAFINLKMNNLKSIVFYGMDPGGEKRMKCLKAFLQSVSLTLNSLHLGQRLMFSPEYKSRLASPFPVYLPKLTKLSIGPGFVNSMKFFNKLPNLNTFTCVRRKSEDWTKLVRKGAPNLHESIKCLDLGDVNHIPLQKLGPFFPNLTKLELNLSRVENHDEILRAIFGNYPKLQMFSFYDLSNQNKLTDSAITGIPTTISITSIRENPESARKFPYIGDLKCLIDLRLQYLSGKLTDASVEFGIKYIPSLYVLDLSNSQITDASLEIIAKSCPTLTLLYIRDCSKITNEGRSQFQKIRKDVQLRFEVTHF